MTSVAHAHGHDHEHDLPGADVLRGRGRRLTVQRAAVWEALAAEPDLHLSAEQVAERVQAKLPQVNASTIYRTLDTLAEEGLVLRTDLGAGRTFFEVAHEHRHHHLVCERCGTVEHVHDDLLAGVEARLLADHGFRLGDREVTLVGLCRRCSSA
jgi:Fur family ferric uptake transcriptional regulator